MYNSKGFFSEKIYQKAPQWPQEMFLSDDVLGLIQADEDSGTEPEISSSESDSSSDEPGSVSNYRPPQSPIFFCLPHQQGAGQGSKPGRTQPGTCHKFTYSYSSNISLQTFLIHSIPLTNSFSATGD